MSNDNWIDIFALQMSHQTLNPTSASVSGQDLEGNASFDGNSENEYPFGTPIVLCRNVATQMVFIRKVWAILAIHLFIITLVTSLLYLCDWRHIIQRFIWIWWISLISSVVLLLVLTYKSNDIYQPPWYLIIVYVLLNSYTIGSIDLICVIDLLIILSTVSFSMIGFTYQTRYRFKSKGPIIFIFITITIISLVLHPLVFSIIDAIPAVLIALLLSLFFVLDTWYMMDSMNKDEFRGASMQLILDLLVPFRCIHHISELTAEFW
ncbi:3265_t:CDS:2 [Cetraspora pellucida]|uniref:3265_t:CDS:1 n=1 Tax=Cetraspora pellucida TaxID=1433469 RepID=A0A9N9D9P0_9GLOM|nr:3265_t:CDS:2 [Cetraspora pellucida]